jgi:hypothetical protein
VTSQEGVAAGKPHPEADLAAHANAAIRLPRKKLFVLIVGILVADGISTTSLTAIPWYMTLLATCAFTALGAFVTWAAEERILKKRVKILWITLGVALVIPLGAVTYHYLSPSTTSYLFSLKRTPQKSILSLT